MCSFCGPWADSSHDRTFPAIVLCAFHNNHSIRVIFNTLLKIKVKIEAAFEADDALERYSASTRKAFKTFCSSVLDVEKALPGLCLRCINDEKKFMTANIRHVCPEKRGQIDDYTKD